MAKSAVEIPAVSGLATPQERVLKVAGQIMLVIGGSLFVALCARKGSISLMPLTPVPLTVQNLGVLLVGLLLGSRRGFAALILYLVEGMVGLPVFNPTGLGGVSQLFGVTGGFLLVYPFVAFVAGHIFERGPKTFARAVVSGICAEVLLFVGGLTWLYAFTHSLAKAAYLGFYFFIAAEVMKVMFAAAIATRLRRRSASDQNFGIQ